MATNVGAKTAVAKDEALVAATLALMADLTAVMVDECRLVQKQDIVAVQELARRKNKLIDQYHANMKTLAAQPDILKSQTPERRASLKSAGQTLAEATERSAQSLKAAALATESLIQNIVGIVRKEVLPQHGYANPRTAHLALGVYSPTCRPVAVNRTA